MEWLQQFSEAVQRNVLDSIPEPWGALRTLLEARLAEALPPITILPLAACKAVDGDPLLAVPLAAALIPAVLSAQIIDDIADKDRPGQLWEQLGDIRALNIAGVAQLHTFNILSRSGLPADLFRRVNQLYIDAFFYLALGQDRDFSRHSRSVQDYWSTIALKTATPYAAACSAGAMVVTDNVQLIQACHLFGHHLGLAVQIFNDFESLWMPEGKTDIEQGKVTLPLVYGLEFNHPNRDELARLVDTGEFVAQSDRIKLILEGIDTRAFLVWAALQERNQAVAALQPCPNEEGKLELSAFISGMFADMDELLNADLKG